MQTMVALFTAYDEIATRRLQRRSLRLPTGSKSAQTGHLCITAQAGAVQEFLYVDQNFLVLKWKEVLISKYGIEIEHIKQKELFRRIRVSGFFHVHQRSN